MWHLATPAKNIPSLSHALSPSISISLSLCVSVCFPLYPFHTNFPSVFLLLFYSVSLCLFLCLFLYLYLSLSLSLSISHCVSITLFFHLFISPSLCLFILLSPFSISLPPFISVSPWLCRSTYLFLYLSFSCLTLFLYVCLSDFLLCFYLCLTRCFYFSFHYFPFSPTAAELSSTFNSNTLEFISKLEPQKIATKMFLFKIKIWLHRPAAAAQW